MERSKTHYEALGVSRSATPKQIKNAYIALVKRHHPDRLLHVGQSESGLDMRGINLAYSVLKDPAKRRQYDRELEGRSLRRPPPAQRPPPKRRRRVPVAALATAIAAALFAQLLIAGAELDPGRSEIGDSAAALISTAANLGQGTRLDADQVDFTPAMRMQATHAMGSSPTEAIQLSGRCFARARDESRPASADPCVVFDLAFLYSHQGGPPALDASYFEERNVERRALDALAGFGSTGAAERLDALKAATFNMLLDQVQALAAAEEHRSEALRSTVADAPAEEESFNLQ